MFRYSGTNWAGIEWFTVPAVTVLGQQITIIRPGVFPTDGTVASRIHDQVSPTSDHSPDGDGAVRAIDFGGDTGFLADTTEQMRLSEDRRIKYVIHNERMFSSYPKPGYPPYTWRPYTGANGHITHAHVSTLAEFDDVTDQWSLQEEEPVMTDHEHQPMPDQLPRLWANGVWERYVAATGTQNNTRTWTMYREYMAWVWEREIVPLEEKVSQLQLKVVSLENQLDALERRVDELSDGSGGLVLPANVRMTEIP